MQYASLSAHFQDGADFFGTALFAVDCYVSRGPLVQRVIALCASGRGFSICIILGKLLDSFRHVD